MPKRFVNSRDNDFAQWWDATSANYLDGFANANPEYAWLFACCYVEEK